MTADQFREASLAIRRDRLEVNEQLVAQIEADVREFRRHRAAPEPPAAIAELLPLMGWLVYEASLRPPVENPAAFDVLGPQARATSLTIHGFIVRLANVARAMPWPELAPRALGALRGQALAESKRDTPQGYDAAWRVHEEIEHRLADLHERLSKGPERPALLLALEETALQLALAETGTACRTAERMVSRWAEGVAVEQWSARNEPAWVRRLCRDLSGGLSSGKRALSLAAGIERRHGFVRVVDEHRMTLHTAYRNPAIMTGRAALTMLAMSHALEILGDQPGRGHGSWRAYREELRTTFADAYRMIERPIPGLDGRPIPPGPCHLRSLVQLRLTTALLEPGTVLASRVGSPPPLALDHLDELAAEALAAWLAEAVDERQRADAGLIGSATMPVFLRSIEACRADCGVYGGYREWRRRWAALDRHTSEAGRAERVDEFLRMA
jgi:hypothetical protein